MKPKIIKALDKLDAMMLDALRQKFPNGYEQYLIRLNEKLGYCKALPFETDEYSYLIKMPNRPEAMYDSNSIVDEEEDLVQASMKIEDLYSKKKSKCPEDIFNYDDVIDEQNSTDRSTFSI